MLDAGKINVFTGHFGSGKTETAINYAVMLHKTGYMTTLADMDIVNPYFRSADAKMRLETMGIRVIAPVFANTNTDVPALPGTVNRIFQEKNGYAVMDIGGDDLGARVVSTYRKKIIHGDYRHFFVVNARRPLTSGVKEIVHFVREIEETAGLPVTGLVNNTNVMAFTTINDIMEGSKMIGKAAEILGLPISFHCFMGHLLHGKEGMATVINHEEEHFLETEKDKILIMQKYIGELWGVS